MNPNAGRPDLRDLISPSENSRHCKAVLSQYHDERFPRVPPEMLMGVQALYEQEPKARLRWWETIPITAKLIGIVFVVIFAREAGNMLRERIKLTWHSEHKTKLQLVFGQDGGYQGWAKHVALLMRGPHNQGALYDCCWDSIEHNLLKPLRTGGAKVDTFVGTINSKLAKDMYSVVRPIDVWNMDPSDDPYKIFYMSLENLRAYSVRHNVQYDMIIVTRFDVVLQVNITQLPVHAHRFHFLWGELDSKGTPDGWRKMHMTADAVHVLAGEHAEPLAHALRHTRQALMQEHKSVNEITHLYDSLVQMIHPRDINFLVKGFCSSNTSIGSNPVYRLAGPQQDEPSFPPTCPLHIGVAPPVPIPSKHIEDQFLKELSASRSQGWT